MRTRDRRREIIKRIHDTGVTLVEIREEVKSSGSPLSEATLWRWLRKPKVRLPSYKLDAVSDAIDRILQNRKTK